MEFSKLYDLIVEADKFVPADKSDSSDDNSEFGKEADKIAKQQSADDTVGKEDDPFRKLGATAGEKLANRLFGTQHTPKAAAKALSVAKSKKVAADNIPSWVWTQSIDPDLHGDDRVNARKKLKDDYTASLKGEKPKEDPVDEPVDEPVDNEQTPEEHDKEVSDEIDKLTDELEDSGEELSTSDIDDLVKDIKDDKKREAKKEEVKKKYKEILKAKKAERAASAEEKSDKEKKDKAKELKLKA